MQNGHTLQHMTRALAEFTLTVLQRQRLLDCGTHSHNMSLGYVSMSRILYLVSSVRKGAFLFYRYVFLFQRFSVLYGRSTVRMMRGIQDKIQTDQRRSAQRVPQNNTNNSKASSTQLDSTRLDPSNRPSEAVGPSHSNPRESCKSRYLRYHLFSSLLF